MAYPYEALAIMGSSGAGKTTLLNVLTGSKAGGLSVTGERCINERRATPEYVSSVSAYVHQDDLFIGALTVREHLTFVARVRMRGSKASERRERVKVVMQEVSKTRSSFRMLPKFTSSSFKTLARALFAPFVIFSWVLQNARTQRLGIHRGVSRAFQEGR